MGKIKDKDRKKEKAYALYATCGNISEVAKTLKISYSTVRGWINEKPPDKLDKIRNEKKKEFIESANEFIAKGMRLANNKLDRAIQREEEIDRLIEAVSKSPDDEVPQNIKMAVIKNLKTLQIQDIKSLAISIGTIYDKRDIAETSTAEKDGGGVVLMPKIKDLKIAGN